MGMVTTTGPIHRFECRRCLLLPWTVAIHRLLHRTVSYRLRQSAVSLPLRGLGMVPLAALEKDEAAEVGLEVDEAGQVEAVEPEVRMIPMHLSVRVVKVHVRVKLLWVSIILIFWGATLGLFTATSRGSFSSEFLEFI